MSLLLGLTGNIACGKSTVGEIFKSYGIKVLDSDEVVYEIYAQDEDVQKALMREFGTLDRKKIAQGVFGKDKTEKRKILESIIHPKVDLRLRDWVKENQADEILVNLVPLLFEAKLESRYDYIITVTADKELQIARLKERNPDLSMDDINKRIESQLEIAEKLRRSDFSIDNSLSIDDLDIQVEEILEQIISKEKLSIQLISHKV